MFLVVDSIQRPKGFKVPACRQQDFIPTRMHGHELGDVIDATFVSDPHAIFQRAVTGDLFLGEDGESRGLLYGLHSDGVCLLSLRRREERRRQFCDPSKRHLLLSRTVTKRKFEFLFDHSVNVIICHYYASRFTVVNWL